MHTEQVFAEALERLTARAPSLKLDLDWQTTVVLVAQVQLALRHPGNRGPSAELARTFLDTLIARVEEVEPTVARCLRMGDDPQHDVPKGGG
jgi:hypothetical protein